MRVAFSEAMDETTVRDASHYRLNGSPVPTTTVFECEIASCTWVRLVFAPSAFAYGANNTLTVSDVRDLAGKTIDPATSKSGAFQVY
ncbi:MAG TPA: Ig-like domain-containing protein [Candidatus Acidoferrales bacterium]|nr:Ig-like domain-containing protein [Candidatus Acidoferrales bacterium]